ncbi:MAG: hypothetical protein NZ739_11600, partial [Verrucomicrobiae bacterium]|nr:hypothetical protein [Verrucomicrobiae bacterium]MDW7980856.1 hypothetical protein [Verrucomicrobiales bacterium]
MNSAAPQDAYAAPNQGQLGGAFIERVAWIEPATNYPWVPDCNDGTYRNPIIYADYPDPDVIRVGDEF